MEINYRSGEKKDCAKLSELINIASHGVVDYLFGGLIPGMTPIQIIAHNLESDHYPFSYKSAVVAIDKNDMVGMALSYPACYHKITDEMRSFFPADRLRHFYEFYSSRVENSWYLDALCVIKSHRKNGIGEKLISLTKEKAIENGYNTLSLIVFADNMTAIPFYESVGFTIAKRVELQGNKFIKHKGGCLLMKCDISS
jgi:ribosomal protein S18 acetylase RimI-like enzyme